MLGIPRNVFSFCPVTLPAIWFIWGQEEGSSFRSWTSIDGGGGMSVGVTGGVAVPMMAAMVEVAEVGAGRQVTGLQPWGFQHPGVLVRGDNGRMVTPTTESPGSRPLGMARTHLLRDGADLLCRQIVKGENEPPVKVAFAAQGPIMYICFLLVLFKANHPTRQQIREHI